MNTVKNRTYRVACARRLTIDGTATNSRLRLRLSAHKPAKHTRRSAGH